MTQPLRNHHRRSVRLLFKPRCGVRLYDAYVVPGGCAGPAIPVARDLTVEVPADWTSIELRSRRGRRATFRERTVGCSVRLPRNFAGREFPVHVTEMKTVG